MSDELFSSYDYNPEQTSIVVLTNDYGFDFVFSSFEDWLGEDRVQEYLDDEYDKSELLGDVYSYLSLLITELAESDDSFMMITQSLRIGSVLIVTVELSADALKELGDQYSNSSEIEAMVFTDEDEDGVPADEDDDEDEEDEEDEWKV